MREFFTWLANKTSHAVGSYWAFLIALLVVLVWACTGPVFGYSNTWQLVINSCTTIVTFLMVFLIQTTQNRDAKAIHLKLDELIRAVHDAHKDMIDVEDLSDERLEKLAVKFRRMREASEIENGDAQQGADETAESAGHQSAGQTNRRKAGRAPN